MSKLDNNQNTEKLTTRDKAQINMLANSISSQLISFFGKNFGALNSNFSNLNQEISNVSENISSINNASYSHIIRDLNKSLNISKSFIKKHLDSVSASSLIELQERKKFLQESNEDNTEELKATNKEIIKITRKLAKDLRGQQAKALAEEAKAKNEARLEEEQQYKVKTRQVDTPESLQQKLKGFIKDPHLDISKLTVKDRVSMVSDLKSGVAPEKILAQIKSLQKSNLEKRIDAFNAENAYYKRENSFYEDLAEVQKDLLKFQDKREQYFDYAEKVVGKLHEQEISIQDRKRLAYDTERKNYIEALKLSKLQQQIEDTRAKTWFLEGGLTKNMIAYRADSEKYIQTVKDNFKNKLLQPFRTMKKWWSNTKSVFSFGKDLIGSFFGRKPTGTQKQTEQVKNNKAEVKKDDTERIKEQQEIEEYHDDVRGFLGKIVDFITGEKSITAKENRRSKSATVTNSEETKRTDWVSWLALITNFLPGGKIAKGLVKTIWNVGKFGFKSIGSILKGTGKFVLNPKTTSKAWTKAITSIPGTINSSVSKQISNIGKSISSKTNAVKSRVGKTIGKAVTLKNTITKSETGQFIGKQFSVLKDKIGNIFKSTSKTIKPSVSSASTVSKALKTGSTISKAGGKAIPVIGTALAVGAGGYEVYENLEKGDTKGAVKAGVGTAGALGGALAGAKGGAALGAAIGSVVPGIGTAIGTVAGGLIGTIAGGLIGQYAGEKIGKTVADSVIDSNEKPIQNIQSIPAKEVISKSKPIPKIERAPVNNNNTQQNNNNGRDDAKLASILERIDSKIGNVAENTANPRVTSVPVPMETSVADYSGGVNAQMQGI